MSKKDSESIATVGVLLVVWVGFGITKQILIFYWQHPILTWSILILALLVGIFLFAVVKVLRERKWYAIEEVEDMHKLHWREFEEFIEFILKQKGFKTQLWQGTKDGGVDIEASFEWRKYLIQCKKWQKYKVSEPNIREFLWAISDFNIDAKGIYITTSHLTSDAKIFAERNDIEIWDKYSLQKHVDDFLGIEWEESSIQKDVATGKCEKCWGNMIKRTARYGENAGNEFLGCENYPKCRNIVNL